MKHLFIDTSVLINYTRKNDNVLRDLLIQQDKGEVELFVGVIVVTEFFSGTEINNVKFLLAAIKIFQEFFTIIEVGFQEGMKAGQLRRSNTIPLTTDAIIAATCILNDFELVTNDVKHFSEIEELKLYKIES